MFHLRFDSLRHAGYCLAFPCDSHGAVDIDSLPEAARNSYFAARALLGREFARPVVEALDQLV